MKKKLNLILILLVLASLLVACGGGENSPANNDAAADNNAAADDNTAADDDAADEDPIRIAYFVSDLSNVLHQAQFAAAKEYALEEYGAEVVVFDGKSDSAVMTANVDQVLAQGFDAATLQIWDSEAAKPGVMDALDAGIVMTGYFGPLADTGIPVFRHDEAGISFEMGRQMAEQWIAAYPDKPVVMVQLGWPNHTEVTSGRTAPFVEGVLSVAPDATNLGCLDASSGPDAAKQIILDLVTQHPEVNLIYSEASNLTVGTMAGLIEAGRGVMEDGVPLTEIVASVDFDEVEYEQIYDPTSSLKLSMGLHALATGEGRIDLIMDVLNGDIARTTQPAEEYFYQADAISYWTMDQDDAAEWLSSQFGADVD